MAEHPLLTLSPGQDRRLRAGYPWAFSNEIAMTPAHRAWPPGAPVRLEGANGWRYGTFAFNPHSLIAARLLDRDPAAEIDAAWVQARIAAAIALRARVCDSPFHRLVHAEADQLPGLVIDRFGDVAVVQANTAAADRLLPAITAALTSLLPLRTVVARNDSAVRAQEGLAPEVRLLHGEAAEAEVIEAGVHFPIDPLEGQKTGFFFDQRPNRDRIAALAPGARVLDVFCHTGAFGLRAAAAGATSVTLVDSSAPALDRASQAAERNGLSARVNQQRGDAFDVMAALAAAGERFDIVVCDPPRLREVPQGRRCRAACLSPHDAARCAVGVARRLPVRRLLQPSRAAGGVRRPGRRRPGQGPPRRPHPVHRRRWARPSGASEPARKRLSEGAIAAALVAVRRSAGRVHRRAEASPLVRRGSYSHFRTLTAAMPLLSACNGLISTLYSSGTITEGTRSSAQAIDRIQADPTFTLARPAGLASHPTGRLPGVSVHALARTEAGIVTDTR